jgi:hypothetical protein
MNELTEDVNEKVCTMKKRSTEVIEEKTYTSFRLIIAKEEERVT